MKDITKIVHIQLFSPTRDEMTLLTNLVDGSIKHILYSGHSSYGTKLPLSMLGLPHGVHLPVDKLYDDETLYEFSQRILQMIEEDSHMVIYKVVDNNVTFQGFE
jgi:hypothetical protein